MCSSDLPQFSPSLGLFQPPFGDGNQAIDRRVQAEEFRRRPFRSPSDPAFRKGPLQLTGQRQRENRVADVAEPRNQKIRPIPIHGFQSFENPGADTPE